jgi:hypothetical protein
VEALTAFVALLPALAQAAPPHPAWATSQAARCRWLPLIRGCLSPVGGCKAAPPRLLALTGPGPGWLGSLQRPLNTLNQRTNNTLCTALLGSRCRCRCCLPLPCGPPRPAFHAAGCTATAPATFGGPFALPWAAPASCHRSLLHNARASRPTNDCTGGETTVWQRRTRHTPWSPWQALGPSTPHERTWLWPALATPAARVPARRGYPACRCHARSARPRSQGGSGA